MTSITKADLETVELILEQFRVKELHVLLQSFECSKLGKKSELIHRCISLLNNSRNQEEILHKIHEINNTRRYLNLGPTPSSKHQQQPAPSSIATDPQLLLFPQQQGGAIGQQHKTMSNSNQAGLMNANTHQTNQCMQNPPSTYLTCRLMSDANGTRMWNILMLPFFETTQTLLGLCELPASDTYRRSTSRCTFTFHVPVEVRRNLLYGTRPGDPVILPRVELQLRFFELDTARESIPDDFPPACQVKIDNAIVQLPFIVRATQPNAESKRPSRPVCITSYIQNSRDADAKHNILIEWRKDRRAWAVGIFVVNRLTVEILRSRLVQSMHAHVDIETTHELVQKTLRYDDDDPVQTESIKIPLICPLGKTRIVTPVRGVRCAHLHCFDLLFYLQVNEQRPTWKCPVCDKHTPYDRLIIDGYFEDAIRRTSADTYELNLFADGNWCAVVNGCSDDNSGPSAKRSRSDRSTTIEGGQADNVAGGLPGRVAGGQADNVAGGQGGTHGQGNTPTPSLSIEWTKHAEPKVIVLDDSDSDVELIAHSSHTAPGGGSNATTTRRHSANTVVSRRTPATNASAQIEYITLDDSDPDDVDQQLLTEQFVEHTRPRIGAQSQGSSIRRRPPTPINDTPAWYSSQYSPVPPAPPPQPMLADMNNAAGGSGTATGDSASGGSQHNGGTASASLSHESVSSTSWAFAPWYANPQPPIFESNVSATHFGPNGYEPHQYPVHTEAYNNQFIPEEWSKFMASIHNATSR